MKSINKGIAIVTAVTTATMFVAENKKVKIAAGVVAAIAGGVFLTRVFKKTLDQVNKEADETEKMIEKSGINISELDSDLLDENEEDSDDEEEPSSYVKELYLQSRNIYNDDILDAFEGFSSTSLHVLKNKNGKLVIGIQLPKTTKSSNKLTGYSIYRYFKEEVLDFSKEELGINPNLINVYQKGFVKVERQKYIFFDEIEKIENEKTNEYVKRINTILESWDIKKFREEKIEQHKKDGEILKGYENFMFFEFPVQKNNGDILPGMTISKAMILINELMGTQYDIPNSQGIDIPFEFDHMIFHPGSELNEYYDYDSEEKTIEIMVL